MSDTISRQDAVNVAMQYCPDDDGTCSKSGNDLRELLDDLEALPPAEPERMKGHWVDGKCDKCGEHAPYWAMASTYYRSNFCPNCGAKMDAQEEE